MKQATFTVGTAVRPNISEGIDRVKGRQITRQLIKRLPTT